MTEDEIKARLAAATPGPWFARENDLIGGWCVRVVDTPPSEGPGEVADFIREEDARLVAAAPADIAALLAEVERLRAGLADIEQIVLDGMAVTRHDGITEGEWRATARIVAWLNAEAERADCGHIEDLADRIERGEHRREEKP